MAQSLASPPAATAASPPLSTRAKNTPHFASSLKIKPRASLQGQDDQNKLVHRRAVGLGLAVAVLSLFPGVSSANAAARRPPPPEEDEKKDPNVSGTLAKVLASKKRKEAMKEAMVKLREKGKPITE